MKRIITSLLIFAFLIPFGVNAQYTDSSNNISLKINNVPTIYGTSKISIQRDLLLDLSFATITWSIKYGNAAYMDTINKSGIGADTYSLYFINSSPVDVTVDILMQDGSTYSTTATYTPYVIVKQTAPNDILIMQRANELDKVEIRTNPSRVRAFQRVEFYVEPTPKNKDYELKDKVIAWAINGKVVSPGIIGQTSVSLRLISPSASTTVNVMVMDGVNAYKDEITFLPEKDPSLRFSTSQATRVLYCMSSASRMIDSDIKRLKREEERIVSTSKEAIDKIQSDVAFLTNTVDDIAQEFADTAVNFVSLAGSILVKSKGDSQMISVAKRLRDVGKYILDNPISVRLKYIYERIEYYTRLINWYNNTQYRIQAEIKSAATQIEFQKQRCIDMANEKPDFSVDTGQVNEFRQYEW